MSGFHLLVNLPLLTETIFFVSIEHIYRLSVSVDEVSNCYKKVLESVNLRFVKKI